MMRMAIKSMWELLVQVGRLEKPCRTKEFDSLMIIYGIYLYIHRGVVAIQPSGIGRFFQ